MRIKTWMAFEANNVGFKYNIDEIEDYFLDLKELHGYDLLITRGYRVGNSGSHLFTNLGNNAGQGKLAYRIHISKKLNGSGKNFELVDKFASDITKMKQDISAAIDRVPNNLEKILKLNISKNTFSVTILLIEKDQYGEDVIQRDELTLLRNVLEAGCKLATRSRGWREYSWGNYYTITSHKFKPYDSLITDPIAENEITVSPTDRAYTNGLLTNDSLLDDYQKIIDKLDDAKILEGIYFDRKVVYLKVKIRTAKGYDEREIPVLKVIWYKSES